MSIKKSTKQPEITEIKKKTCVYLSGDWPPERIRELRRSYGFSVDIMAAIMEVTPTVIRDWEKGKQAPRKTQRRFLDVLYEGCFDISDLVYEP